MERKDEKTLEKVRDLRGGHILVYADGRRRKVGVTEYDGRRYKSTVYHDAELEGKFCSQEVFETDQSGKVILPKDVVAVERTYPIRKI